MFFGCTLRARHGGIFVIHVNGLNRVLKNQFTKSVSWFFNA